MKRLGLEGIVAKRLGAWEGDELVFVKKLKNGFSVEVEFVEWTSARKLRHAFFRRLMTPDEESSSRSQGGSTRRRAGRP